MTDKGSLPSTYFEDMYAGTPDPWGFETSAYEREKYDRTIAALGDRRYALALEVGCANGVMTRRLAGRAGALLAIDVSSTALARAKACCRDLTSVSFERMAFPVEAPDGPPFDLVVMSEVAYYWGAQDLALAAAWLRNMLAKGGDLLLVHWTGETDYPQTGDAAVDGLRVAFPDGPLVLLSDRTADYRLDLWRCG